MSSPLFATTGRVLFCCSAAFSLPLMAQESPLDRSFNADHYWSGGPGWATIPFDHPGRSAHDAAMSMFTRSDGTMIIAGLAGRDSAAGNSGLLAAVSLNTNGSANSNWSSAADLRGGALTGRITWSHLDDQVHAAPIFDASAEPDIVFSGSGRVGTATLVNQAKYFSVTSRGRTITGGLGICELHAGGAARDFHALGLRMRNDVATLAGYVRRSSDGAYLPAACDLSGGVNKTQTVSDSLPGFPTGTIGALGVAPHYSSWSFPAIYSRRLIRTVSGITNQDAILCNPGAGQYYPSTYDNCAVFQPNIGGHLDDVLHSVKISGITTVTGLIESQAQSSPGVGSDRTVLTIARPPYYNVEWNGIATSRPAQQQTFSLSDATSPSASLSFHYPRAVDDYRNGGTLWVVMALRPFPGPDEFREIAVARFTFADLTLDTTFGGGTGWRRYSLGGAEVMPSAVDLDNLGRLVIAGSRRQSPDSDNWDFFVMRINDDAIFDDGFSG